MTTILENRFAKALRKHPNGPGLLEAGYAAEENYRELTLDLLCAHGAPETVLADHGSDEAFSGGRAAAIAQLQSVTDWLVGTSDDLPPTLVRWWPDRMPDARCTLGEGGALIRINLGMLTQVRMLLHLLASCLNAVIEDARLFGEDQLTVDEARAEFLSTMNEFVGGEPLELRRTVLVHWGNRERFRRLAMRGALAYVVAHELGHARAPNTREAADAALGDLGEASVMLVHSAEATADLDAFAMLRRAADLDNDPQLAFAFAAGACAALAAQACLFWFTAAQGTEPLSWTHPVADVRMGLARLGLGEPQEAVRLGGAAPLEGPSLTDETQARRLSKLTAWLDEVTGIAQFRSKALEQDLETRGLSKIQLALIYMIYGVPNKI